MVRSHDSVVITGASTGIGEACARELDRRGFRVFAGVRKDSDAERLKQNVSERLTPVRIDVTDEGAVHAAAARIAEAVDGGLAGLINNAGIAVGGPLELVPLEALRQQFEVNVVGQIAAIQAFLPLLRKCSGRIVNMSSVNGRLTVPFMGPYAASKHAFESLSDALRNELRRWNVHVSLIEPGAIATPIWDKSLAANDDLLAQASPRRATLYEDDMPRVRKAVSDAAERALPVESVTRALLHALTSPRPKTRYPIDFRVGLSIRLMRWLPDRTADWFLRRAMGLR